MTVYTTLAADDENLRVEIIDSGSVIAVPSDDDPLTVNIVSDIVTLGGSVVFSVNGENGFVNLDTNDIPEGTTNLYYTDARVDARIATVVDGAPAALDTLNELAAALNDDANFATTVTNQLALKLNTADFDTTADTYLKSGLVTEINIDNSATLSWNPVDGTVDLAYDGVTLQVGQEEHFYAKATEVINNGDVVMFAGAQGDHLLIAQADAQSVGFRPEYVIGVATQDFAINEFGYVTSFGKVRELDTDVYSEGAIIYLDPNTPGGWTTTEPTPPDHIIQIAAVTRSHPTQGTIFVRPTHMPDTDEIPEGSTNLYYTDARVDARIALIDEFDDLTVTNSFVTTGPTDLNASPADQLFLTNPGGTDAGFRVAVNQALGFNIFGALETKTFNNYRMKNTLLFGDDDGTHTMIERWHADSTAVEAKTIDNSSLAPLIFRSGELTFDSDTTILFTSVSGSDITFRSEPAFFDVDVLTIKPSQADFDAPVALMSVSVGATLPGSPDEGDRFLDTSDGVLKVYADGVWNNLQPRNGSMVYDNTNHRTLVRENGGWRVITTTAL